MSNTLMASIAQHKADCQRFLGDDFEKVNRWMDELFAVYGPYHRKMRHHTEGIEQARSLFGDEGASAAAIHILRDCRHIPRREDYDSGIVDALGLKKSWSTLAYIRYSEKEFENVVNQMLRPSGLMLWAFVDEPGVRVFLSSLTKLDPEQVEARVSEWRDARRRLESLPPFLTDLANIEFLSDKAPPVVRDFVAAMAQSPLLNSIKPLFNDVSFAYVPVDQLINPLVYIDYEYLEELKPDITGSDPIDIWKFALPERITTRLKAITDPTQKSMTFISNQKGLTVSPMRVQNTPEGTEVSFLVTASGTAILVGENSGRLFLKNGIHRAYLLAQMGLSRIPCIVVREQGPLANLVSSYPAFTASTLSQLRPPLLVDFFKPELSLQVPLQRTHKLVRVSAEETIVPID